MSWLTGYLRDVAFKSSTEIDCSNVFCSFPLDSKKSVMIMLQNSQAHISPTYRLIYHFSLQQCYNIRLDTVVAESKLVWWNCFGSKRNGWRFSFCSSVSCRMHTADAKLTSPCIARPRTMNMIYSSGLSKNGFEHNEPQNHFGDRPHLWDNANEMCTAKTDKT